MSEAQGLRLVAEGKLGGTSTSIAEASGEYRIDEAELKRLVRLGVVTKNYQYVYLAIQIDYRTDELNIPTEIFCDKWSLTKAQFLSAIAALGKKGLLGIGGKNVEIKLFANQLCLNMEGQ